jgi:hypothetical protein
LEDSHRSQVRLELHAWRAWRRVGLVVFGLGRLFTGRGSLLGWCAFWLSGWDGRSEVSVYFGSCGLSGSLASGADAHDLYVLPREC